METTFMSLARKYSLVGWFSIRRSPLGPRYSSMLLWLALGCGARPTTEGTTAEKRTDSAKSQALAAARACIKNEPERYASVWGSPLQYDRADVQSAPAMGPRVFVVSIPEGAPQGLPLGRDVRVDLDTGECEPLDME